MSRTRPVLLALLVAVMVLAPVAHVTVVSTASPLAGTPATPTSPSAGSTAYAAPDTAPSPLEPATADALATTDGAIATARLQPNTSNYLEIREEAVERTAQDRASLNVAGAVQQDVTDLRSEYASLTFERRYENTTGQAARQDVLRSEVDRLERRVQQLELRRNRAIDDYNAGDTETEAFFRELAAIDAAARDVESQFSRIRRAAGLALPSGLDTKMDNLEGDLLTLRGPVRQQIAQAMSGAHSSMPVYAVTSQTGLVLASNQGARYYREAYLGQNREQTGENRFVTDGDPSGISTANSRAAQLYPWAYDNIRSGPNVETVGNTSVYFVELRHLHGSLETYLDGRTESVFREFQTKPLDTFPTRSTVNASGGVVLRVNRTHATGPMELTVTDNATGEPLDAAVTINGDDVGSTGDDGRLWTLTPHRAVRISVTTDDGRIVSERFFAG